CGSHEDGVRKAAARYGYDHYTTDWKELVTDPEVDVFDNVGPNNLHAEPCIAAAKAGKHVLCEKPLARNAEEAKEMWDAAKAASVKHMCGFNYRFVPAIRLAKEMLDAGELGEIYHFRASYQQEWIMDADFPQVWRLNKKASGSGALGDLGAHIIDLARFLIGEPETLSATTKTFIPERPSPDGKGTVNIDVDDAFEAIVRFRNGAVGTLEASRFCAGRKNHMTFEINGSKGSIAFNLEKLNSLQVYFREETNQQLHGFREVLVTESDHPFYSVWWPHGHILGWEHAHIHEINHFLDAIANDKSVAPYGATFEDGYKAAVICDAILHSAQTHTEQQIVYE
ncbi:MAG: Gfo/Idh/MocA family oxidoreductase, partial [Candidatus Bipolaricaulota bacterium]|nr:Gfo/Idh/MocA family oxidoreductase [Candidatus Bipolaricaulota bacterium]